MICIEDIAAVGGVTLMSWMRWQALVKRRSSILPLLWVGLSISWDRDEITK